MQIGPRIQTLRRSRGWTQEQLAQALKVSRQAVSKWEAGQEPGWIAGNGGFAICGGACG